MLTLSESWDIAAVALKRAEQQRLALSTKALLECMYPQAMKREIATIVDRQYWLVARNRP